MLWALLGRVRGSFSDQSQCRIGDEVNGWVGGYVWDGRQGGWVGGWDEKGEYVPAAREIKAHILSVLQGTVAAPRDAVVGWKLATALGLVEELLFVCVVKWVNGKE